MSKSAEQVWQSYMQYMKEGREDWQLMLAENVEFIGPVQQVKGKDEFIKLNADFFQLVRGYDIIRYAAGENLIVTEAITTIAAPNDSMIDINLAEFYEINEGQIQCVKIFYDPTEFKKAFNI